MASLLLVGSALGPASLCVALVVMGLLSRRLGAVTRMPGYYRIYYIAAGFMAVSVVARLWAVGGVTPALSLLYTTSFAVGMTLGVVMAWRYWGWLFGERV